MRLAPRVLVIASAIVLLVEAIVVLPRPQVLTILAVQAWMALPGVMLLRAAFGSRDRSGIAAWLAGPIIGFGISVFGLLLFWAGGIHNWIALVGAPALTWVLAVAARRSGGLSMRLPVFDRRDVAAVALTVLLVPIITWAPYDHVAERVADGEAYRAYFTADFVWAMTVAAELEKGQVPPVNPFLAGETIHYYWMAHLLSGALYHNVRGWDVTVEQVILLDGLAFSVAFVAFCYVLVRMAGANPVFAALALAVGFLANSYEFANRWWVLRQAGEPFDWRAMNIDAVTRWFYQGMPVDGLQRLFLYQPHHLTGYALALAALWVVGFAEDARETSVALWAGILLGLAFLFSTFTAILVGASVGLLFAVRLIVQRAYWAAVQNAIIGGGTVLAAVGISVLLGYTDRHAGMLMHFSLNAVATRRWPLMFLLSFGPLLFAGVVGLGRFQWVRGDGAAVAALVFSAVVFYFTADVPDMSGVWVGWRSGHLLLIAGCAIGGALFTAAWQRRRLRLPLAIVSLIAIAPALPTVAADVYNAQDIDNRRRGPTFPWTLIVTPQEREALDWIKRHTAPDAIVQMEPVARETQSWAFVPAFAERRMAAGRPISMIPLRPYFDATDAVRLGIFQAQNAQQAHLMAKALAIDYLYVGDLERHYYRALTNSLAEHPNIFAPAFKNDSVTVYKVERRSRIGNDEH